MLVLSVDPGTICTGWSLFEDAKPRNHGKVHIKSTLSQSERLSILMKDITNVIIRFNPDILAIEDQFVGRNPRASLVTARAKGIVIAVAAACGIKVIEYSPCEIKKAVTGKGNANKQLVQEEILALYSSNDTVKEIGEFKSTGKGKNDDIYDAIGINHTYWVLGEDKIVDIKKKDRKKEGETTKTISRAI